MKMHLFASLVVRFVGFEKLSFSPIMLVANVCANICRLGEKWAKCLKISENALRIQIFLLYLPDFSRVALTCVRSPDPRLVVD